MADDDERFYIVRDSKETWREAAGRFGRAHGLEQEVTEAFDRIMRSRPDADEASVAFQACFEWDCCNLTAGAR